MPSLEINEILVLIIISMGLLMYISPALKYKSLLKWLPGFVAIWITFLSTNLEALTMPDMFNFMEHTFALLAGVFMCGASVLEFYQYVLNKKIPIKTELKLKKKEVYKQ